MGERLAHEIEDLKRHGSSLAMNWGEDTGMWEVAWITGGVRFVSVGPDLALTLANCRAKAYTHFGRKEAPSR